MKEQNGVIEMEAGSVDWEVMSDMIGIDEDGKPNEKPANKIRKLNFV